MTNKASIEILKELMYPPTRADGKSTTHLMINVAIETAIKALEQSEIIRCADCKWLQCNMRPDGILPKGVDEFECRHWCGGCDPVDFCSYAERGDEE